MASDFRALIEMFAGRLAAAQKERPAREELTASGELGWVVYERDQLLAMVNRERAAAGLPAAGIDAILRIERSAAGHVDYTQKLAIGAAELVYGLGPWEAGPDG